MKALLGMLNMSKVGGVQEDAFMAVGTLVECMELNLKIMFYNLYQNFIICLIKNLQILKKLLKVLQQWYQEGEIKKWLN